MTISNCLRPSIFVQRFISLFFPAVVLCVAYLSCWAIKYHEPAGKWKRLDLRRSAQDKPRAISFCATLADNPTGFPGHAYVVWSETTEFGEKHDFSLGFMPKNRWDQLRSLVSTVPGVLLDHTKTNTSNLDMLTVLVSKSDFEHSKLVASKWGQNEFQAGKRDCVSFAAYLADELGLKFKRHEFQFPQDFLTDLKESNEILSNVVF